MAALSRHLSHEVDQKQTSDNKLLAIIAGDKSQAASRSQVLSKVFKHPTPSTVTEPRVNITQHTGLHCSANLIQFPSSLFVTGISLESRWQGAVNTRHRTSPLIGQITADLPLIGCGGARDLRMSRVLQDKTKSPEVRSSVVSVEWSQSLSSLISKSWSQVELNFVNFLSISIQESGLAQSRRPDYSSDVCWDSNLIIPSLSCQKLYFSNCKYT